MLIFLIANYIYHYDYTDRGSDVDMYADERKDALLNYLEQNGSAQLLSLLKITGTSIATLRRDVRRLADERLIEKSRGIVKLKNEKTTRSIIDDDPNTEAKNLIAKIAAKLVIDGDRVFIGAGKTCTFLAKYLEGKDNLVVVTTNLNAVMELSQDKKQSLFLLGGDVHVGSNYVETLDEYTVNSLRNLYFDKVFITVNGVDLNYGYSINSRLQVPLYQHLLRNTNDFFLLADGSKFNKRAFTLLCEMDSIRNVVTLPDIPPEYLEYYQNNGIKIHMG
jgi:DeoR/GlpR family transcriptional regulator of sugar metabolism